MRSLIAVLSCVLLVGCAVVDYQKTRREQYISANPSTDSNIKNEILNGRVLIGMTKDEVVASWGKPDHINSTVTRSADREQWVYYGTYLYFDGDRLTSYQQRRDQ